MMVTDMGFEHNNEKTIYMQDSSLFILYSSLKVVSLPR